ncbi:MAG: transporter transrane region, partial [Gemmatimonadetes bacterium]|nr:transporter transrane region [Gemmatimonadota bacterium]
MTHPNSSRQRYREFVEDYKHGRLDEAAESHGVKKTGGESGAEVTVPAAADAKGMLRGKRREYLREYVRWLWPHRRRIGVVFTFALIAAGIQMVEPLFMRYIIDKVLLNRALDTPARLVRLNLAGSTFFVVIIISSVLGLVKDYRQRILNVRVMLSLRRALFDRLLHLPLPRLWDMKTGGILSRLTGDVETTTGLLQMAIVSPALSIIRLVIGIGVLMTLNWRLALMAMAVIPGAVFISFWSSKRIRPIYRAVRKDAEIIDGRVGETFSGIRVVRAFSREARELVDYMTGRHTVLRKELFAHRRELALWTSWGLMTAMVNVVIVWYGGYLNVQGRASVGDIMAFQWYTFLLMNPVWNIVNSFSELQRSLAAMERVFEVLAMENEKPDRSNATDAP